MMTLILKVLADGATAAVAAAGFASISNPPKKAILISASLAAIGNIIRYYLLNHTPLDITSATFVAAFTIGMLSIFCAKQVHFPAEIFSFPSLLPMIPGMYAYKTILALISFMKNEDDVLLQSLIVEIFRNGLTAFSIMTALVVGVAIPLFIFYEQSFMMTRKNKISAKKQTSINNNRGTK